MWEILWHKKFSHTSFFDGVPSRVLPILGNECQPFQEIKNIHFAFTYTSVSTFVTLFVICNHGEFYRILPSHCSAVTVILDGAQRPKDLVPCHLPSQRATRCFTSVQHDIARLTHRITSLLAQTRFINEVELPHSAIFNLKSQIQIVLKYYRKNP